MTKDIVVPELIEDKPVNDAENGSVNLTNAIGEALDKTLRGMPDNASDKVESVEVECIPVATYKIIVRLNLR